MEYLRRRDPPMHRLTVSRTVFRNGKGGGLYRLFRNVPSRMSENP